MEWGCFAGNKDAMGYSNMQVDDLSCNGCSSAMAYRVLDLPGVDAVQLDAQGETIRVYHDGTTELDKVVSFLQELQMHSEPEPGDLQSGSGSKGSTPVTTGA